MNLSGPYNREQLLACERPTEEHLGMNAATVRSYTKLSWLPQMVFSQRTTVYTCSFQAFSETLVRHRRLLAVVVAAAAAFVCADFPFARHLLAVLWQ